jgi:hypothetical protein
MPLLLEAIQTITMITDRGKEYPSVITATNQDMSRKTAGRFMGNLLIGNHQNQ